MREIILMWGICGAAFSVAGMMSLPEFYPAQVLTHAQLNYAIFASMTDTCCFATSVAAIVFGSIDRRCRFG